MRFKLDENLPAQAAEVLRTAGHDAVHLLDQVAAGAEDARVARLAQKESRALITLDLGFADIGTYPPGSYSGIAVLRPRSSSADEVIHLLLRIARAVESEPLAGRLWIVDERRIRVREGPI